MDEVTAGVLTPETRDLLTAASASGRMLLAMVAGWIDLEAGPAHAALSHDLRGTDDDTAADVAAEVGPDRFAMAMIDVLDTLGRIEGIGADDWQRAVVLSGGWLRERPPR